MLNHLTIYKMNKKLDKVVGSGKYQYIEFSNMKDHKRSDTLFVLGSAPSINDLTPEEIALIEQHDSISMGYFMFKRVIKNTFHLVHDIQLCYLNNIFISYNDRLQDCKEYAKPFHAIKDKQPVCILQGMPTGIDGPMLAAEELLPEGAPFTVYRERKKSRRLNILPDRREWTLIHAGGTLCDCIHFGFLMEYKKIVLVGVELRTREYFFPLTGFLAPINTLPLLELNTTAGRMLVTIPRWAEEMKKYGTELSVYTKKSLLMHFLPLWDWDDSKQN
ncbi:MAG: hypothetical protein CMN79_01465 [Spirochaetales bacterium]|nr:hypothetical protein [Spirochaetales bacterium]